MYRGRLERDLDRWAASGIITPQVRSAMLADYDSRTGAFSVGRVLGILAAVLIAAAVLLLIAANWETLPRLARLGGIVGLIWISHLAAAVFMMRKADLAASIALIIGTAAFGGAIALVGQMYHLSGDALDAALVWLAVTFLSALLFRSAALATFAAILAWTVFWTGLDLGIVSLGAASYPLLYPVPLAAILVLALVRYTGAERASHLCYLLMIAWLGWIYLDAGDERLAAGLALIGTLMFLAATLSISPLRRYAERAGASPAFNSLLLAFMGLSVLHGSVSGILMTALTGSAILGLSLLALALAGRVNSAVRYLAYAAFSAETLYLASETLGSILGTAGFFLIAGLVVGALALLVLQIERRMGKTPTAPADGGVAS